MSVFILLLILCLCSDWPVSNCSTKMPTIHNLRYWHLHVMPSWTGMRYPNPVYQIQHAPSINKRERKEFDETADVNSPKLLLSPPRHKWPGAHTYFVHSHISQSTLSHHKQVKHSQQSWKFCQTSKHWFKFRTKKNVSKRLSIIILQHT